MADCCQDKACEVSAMGRQHARVLWVVLAVNAAMFIVEGSAGLFAHSTALKADALDMLGDALVYGFSLFVIARSASWHARAAMAKGAFMLVFGIAVLGEAAYKALHPSVPNAGLMGLVGGLALIANLGCFGLLYRHRGDNLNMSSTWLCSRNDLMANVGVLIAAALGYVWLSRWPDIIVGTIIAALFLQSAAKVLGQAASQLRGASAGG